ncbi:hypothetical protein BCR34DRAFT_668844 [Clohesyomyces aquaticus]|uniref:Uncharacterized protein n=1 Tax=Clohesyomyces aquaticus TaxID=1231657 RepID=A0A1Y1YIJ2_9PLEO|nr:hypothetical protein BCR34DRAFT_668844 [Clohesyomyces aquaticus]
MEKEWAPAYTVQGIAIQVFSLFSDECSSQIFPGSNKKKSKADTFRCPQCRFGPEVGGKKKKGGKKKIAQDLTSDGNETLENSMTDTPKIQQLPVILLQAIVDHLNATDSLSLSIALPEV